VVIFHEFYVHVLIHHVNGIFQGDTPLNTRLSNMTEQDVKIKNVIFGQTRLVRAESWIGT